MEDINDYGRFESFYRAEKPGKREDLWKGREEAETAIRPPPSPFRFEDWAGSPISGPDINVP